MDTSIVVNSDRHGQFSLYFKAEGSFSQSNSSCGAGLSTKNLHV
jgi:hypothetical protein